MSRLKRYQIFLFFSLLCITFFVFINAINSKYATIDDWVMLRSAQRRALKDASFKNIIDTFKYSHEGLYHPVITISYSIEKTIFGFIPEIFHFNNVILHLINVILLFLILLQISKSFWLSFITTFLFALHPTRVEVVAWISARKDLIYSLFYLLSIFFYTKTYNSTKTKYLLPLSLICFIFACFSKSMAITLPFVLILLDFYKNKLSKESIKIYIPYLIISIFFIIAAINIHYSEEFISRNFNLFRHSINFINAHFNILFYLDKLLLPINLYCMYPFFYNMKTMPPGYILYSPAILYLIIFFVLLSLRKTKHIFFGFSFFLITIFPVCGIFPIGNFAVADRYTYIPYIGLFFIFAKFVLFIYKNYNKYLKIIVVLLCLSIFITLSYLSYKRTICWQKDAYGAPSSMKYYKFGINKS